MKKLLIIACAILILAVAFQASKMASAAQDVTQDDSRMLLSAAGATLELQDIVIRKKNDENNIRVRIKNSEMLSDKFTLQAEIVLKKPGTIKISKAKVENSYPEDSVKNP